VVNIIDTHAHIYLPEFDSDRDAIIDSAQKQGISKILLPNIDLDSIESLHALVAKYPDRCYPMMGLHPCSVKDDFQSVLEKIFALFDQHKFFAVGEIGLDMFWEPETLPIQEKAFRMQVEFALKRNLPIAIHSRDSTTLVLDILQEYSGIRGVFHCFSGTLEEAQRVIALEMYMGIGGVLTFKNGGLAETIVNISLDHLVLETDSPYLAPAPHRGKRNEPAYTWLVAKKLAEIKGKSLQETTEITSVNAAKLFGL
jgi:TatD DNase family protein